MALQLGRLHGDGAQGGKWQLVAARPRATPAQDLRTRRGHSGTLESIPLVLLRENTASGSGENPALTFGGKPVTDCPCPLQRASAKLEAPKGSEESDLVVATAPEGNIATAPHSKGRSSTSVIKLPTEDCPSLEPSAPRPKGPRIPILDLKRGDQEQGVPRNRIPKSRERRNPSNGPGRR